MSKKDNNRTGRVEASEREAAIWQRKVLPECRISQSRPRHPTPGPEFLSSLNPGFGAFTKVQVRDAGISQFAGMSSEDNSSDRRVEASESEAATSQNHLKSTPRQTRMNETEPKTKPNIPKLTFTRAEAAIALGLSVVTIDRLTERGQLKANRATRRPLYSLAELTRFADGPAPTKKNQIATI